MPHRPRPCRFCRKWFRPDARVGARQRACSTPECQAERERAQQAAWRARNPDYGRARRLLELEAIEEADPPAPPRPLDRLPWDLAQMQFGIQGTEFLGQFGRVLAHHAQMQKEVQAHDST
jgi:hypothetical protein